MYHIRVVVAQLRELHVCILHESKCNIYSVFSIKSKYKTNKIKYDGLHLQQQTCQTVR